MGIHIFLFGIFYFGCMSIVYSIKVKVGASATLSFLEPINNTFQQRRLNARSNIVSIALSLTAADEIERKSSAILDVIGNTSCDIEFEFQVIDSLSDYTQLLRQYDHLKSQNFDFDVIIGPKRSAESIPLSFITSVDQTPLVAYSATSSDLDNSNIHKFFSRTIPSDSSVAKSIIDFLVSLNYEYASVIYIEDAYGSAYKNELFEGAENTPLTLAFYPFQKGNSESIQTALTLAKARGVRIFICILFNEDVETLMTAASDIGITGDGYLWIYGDSIGTAQDIQEVLQRSESTDKLAAALNGTIQIKAIGAVDENVNFQKLSQFYADQSGFLNDVENLKKFLPGGQNNSEAEDINNQLFFPGEDLQSVVDDSFYKETTFADFSLFAFDATVVIQRVLELNNCSADALNGPKFMETLVDPQFPFQGVTGLVEFLEETGSRSLESATVRAFNFLSSGIDPVSTFSEVPISDFNGSSGWPLAGAIIRYPPGNNSIPPKATDTPPVDRNEIADSVLYVIYASVAFSYIFALYCIGWTLFNRKKPIVQAAQPEMLITMLVGVLLSSTAPVFLYTDAEEFTVSTNTFRCNAALVFFSIGLTLTTSSACAKLYRITRVVNTKKLKIIKFTVIYALLAVALTFITNVALLVAILLVTPLEFNVIEYIFGDEDQFNELLETYEVCEPENFTLVLVLLAFHVAQYAYGTYLCYEAKDIATDFQEGTYLSISVLSQVQLAILGVAVFIAIEGDQTSVRVLVISLLIFLLNLVLVGLIFLPKIYRVYVGETEVSYVKKGKYSLQGLDSRDSGRYSTSKNSSERKKVFGENRGETEGLKD